MEELRDIIPIMMMVVMVAVIQEALGATPAPAPPQEPIPAGEFQMEVVWG